MNQTNTTNQIVNMLLDKEREITSKFHTTITELLRLGYDTDRGQKEVTDLVESIQYSIQDIESLCKIKSQNNT